MELQRFRLIPTLRRGPVPRTGRFLITGSAGTGKSTIGDILSRCGFAVIDADELAEWKESPGGGDDRLWVWDRRFIDAVHGVPDDPLFVAGGAHNEVSLYHLFDRIFILRVDEAIVRRRLEARERAQNDWDREQTERSLRDYHIRSGQALPPSGKYVDGGRSPHLIVRRILNLAAEAEPPPGSAPPRS